MAKTKTRAVCIPTIGTVLRLAEDWTFDLLAEYRNTHMMAHLEQTGVIPANAPRRLPVLCDQPVEGTMRRTPPAVAALPYWEQRSVPETERWEEVPYTYHCRREQGHDGACDRNARVAQHDARYACTVPRGVALRVDRIYIRKGKADYDSLTFWAQDLTAKRVRFFAKLADVNRMVVLVDAAQTAPLTKAQAARAPQPVFRAILLRE